MKPQNPWTTYRTRFLVKAKQLSASLTFTDILGRLHSGRKGDYLVESADGVLRIAPRQIFEDIYVAFSPDETSAQPCAPSTAAPTPPPTLRTETARKDSFSLPSPSTRKSPQPYRDRRPPAPGIRSL